MKDFEIKAYTKKELALMYFPKTENIPSAVKNLMNWINRCTPLMEALIASGYRKNDKLLSPRQVEMIVYHLGEP